MTAEKSLWWMREKYPDAFDDIFGMATFKQRHARGRPSNEVNPFQNANHFDEGNYEWQRMLRLPDGQSMRSLRCLEDATLGPRRKLALHVLRGRCRVPICQACWWNCSRFASPTSPS